MRFTWLLYQDNSVHDKIGGLRSFPAFLDITPKVAYVEWSIPIINYKAVKSSHLDLNWGFQSMAQWNRHSFSPTSYNKCLKAISRMYSCKTFLMICIKTFSHR